jgi:hypothetical protein
VSFALITALHQMIRLAASDKSESGKLSRPWASLQIGERVGLLATVEERGIHKYRSTISAKRPLIAPDQAFSRALSHFLITRSKASFFECTSSVLENRASRLPSA